VTNDDPEHYPPQGAYLGLLNCGCWQ
jgi:hypothetical protein